MSHHLVHILVSPKLEDAMIDWLLAQAQAPVFETSSVQQYGRPLESLTERVTGFRLQVLFMLQIPALTLNTFLPALEEKFGKEVISYRVLAISNSHSPWPAT